MGEKWDALLDALGILYAGLRYRLEIEYDLELRRRRLARAMQMMRGSWVVLSG